ncbi:MAG: hypothetical protein ACXAB2_16305 [Candidatus Hodarchaeales archaeon]
MSVYTEKITENSTSLLMIAVIAFFINSLFGVLGIPALGSENIVYIKDIGALFALLGVLLNSIVSLCAGLSFAAVCFDEKRNIYFRIAAVGALLLIIYGSWFFKITTV